MKIKLVPKKDIRKEEINNYHIHSMIWTYLRKSKYEKLHNQKKFKFFCFSEIFPIGDFIKDEPKYFFISSPNSEFINYLSNVINETNFCFLGDHVFDIYVEEMFDLSFKKRLITGSPIVLQVEPNVYWSRKYHNIGTFLRRLTENAIKKYNAFYNEEFHFRGLLYDGLKFKKQVAVHIKKHKKDIRIIGTKWEFYLDRNVDPKLEKFYKFLFDCGLGEKNSFGFGFLNPM